MPHSIGHFCRKLCHLLCVTASLMVLAGCKVPPTQANKLESVSMFATNHTMYNVTEFYVNDQWGGSSSALNKGGSIVCCSYLPSQWHEGLTAKVRWTHSQAINDAHGKPIGETVWYEYDAPVLSFQSLQDIVVHFFPDGTAKIVVLSPENVSQPPIPDPVRPKGWVDQVKYAYCDVVNLKDTTKQNCRERLQELYDAAEGRVNIPIKQ